MLLVEREHLLTLLGLADVAPVSPGRRPSPVTPLSSREHALHSHAQFRS